MQNNIGCSHLSLSLLIYRVWDWRDRIWPPDHHGSHSCGHCIPRAVLQKEQEESQSKGERGSASPRCVGVHIYDTLWNRRSGSVYLTHPLGQKKIHLDKIRLSKEVLVHIPLSNTGILHFVSVKPRNVYLNSF